MKKINQKGITLIALVVTIIVLIILAGISISLLLGDNGIIKKAQDVSDKYKEASNEENIKLSDLDERMQGILGGNGIQGGSENGNENNNNNSVLITGALGTPVNVLNYGEKVTNYTAAGLVWRLFYEDSNNIYLISETLDGDYPLKNVSLGDYSNNTFTPKSSEYVSGESVSRQGKDLMPLAGGATTSSAGSIPIGTNNYAINIFTSSNNSWNILSTAYLCDTKANGPWESYKVGSAAWAMGGPTIELFTASYNATHLENQMSVWFINGGYGYANSATSSNSFNMLDNNGIYRLKNSGNWWTASPSYSYQECGINMNDTTGCFINGLSYNSVATNSYALRPVVCIPKSSGFISQYENAPRTGVLGTPVNSDNYGNEVTNYTAAGLKWRLFYEDTNNIYLISETTAGDYPIKNISLCNSENGVYTPKDASYVSGESVSQQGKDLMPLLGGATSSSVGTNSSGVNFFTSSNTSINMYGVAYLCDTTKWIIYKTDSAAWAMGGPTIELYAASYNATHQAGTQITMYIDTYGYHDNCYNEYTLSPYEYNGIYSLTRNNNSLWWITGTGHYSTDRIKTVLDRYGSIGDWVVYETAHLRPIVCIQKSTGFTCNFASE